MKHNFRANHPKLQLPVYAATIVDAEHFNNKQGKLSNPTHYTIAYKHKHKEGAFNYLKMTNGVTNKD